MAGQSPDQGLQGLKKAQSKAGPSSCNTAWSQGGPASLQTKLYTFAMPKSAIMYPGCMPCSYGEVYADCTWNVCNKVCKRYAIRYAERMGTVRDMYVKCMQYATVSMHGW